MNINAAIPNYARSPLTQLRAGKLPEGVTKTELTEQGQQDAGGAAFAVSMLASMDEMEGNDQAMGQPGVVKQDDTVLTFEQADENTMKGLIDGNQTDDGNPAVIFVDVEGSTITTYAVSDLGDQVEIRGAVMTVQGEHVDGYEIAGIIPDLS